MEIILLVCAIVLISIGIYKWQSAEAAKLTLQTKRNEADIFLQKLVKTNTLPEIAVNVVLKKGEKGIFQEQSKLLETRAVRVSAGAGTRIGRIYIGGSRSESHQQYREIDVGTLILTNHRLIFDGSSQNRTTNLMDVMSASAWQDAIEVSSTKRQKSQVYTVTNPLIWASIIQNLASGSIGISGDSVS
jgi:hypothetical protein